MSVVLNSFGGDLRLDGVRLQTLGLEGEVEIFLPYTVGDRSRAPEIEENSDKFEKALENESAKWQRTLVISNARETGRDSRDLCLPSSPEEPVIEIEVPAPEEGWGQFVLALDEAGVASWSFAVPESEGSKITRADETRTYRIPRYVPAPPEPEVAETRGFAGAIGKKVIKVLVFPLVYQGIGRLGVDFSAQWEKKNRPYGIHTVTPENYQQADGGEFNEEAWKKLGEGPALLLVHGTFSRAHTAFAGLPKATMEELSKRYKSRVFAFDHYTLSADPLENVKYFIERIPEGTKLKLDILCHSRGGLLSRVLAEKQSELSLGTRQIEVRRIVFVGVPNAGTILTDGQYLGELLNSYSNLLNFFPDNGFTEMLEGIITVAKMLAVGAVEGLPGLKAMLPQGEFLKGLNQGSQVPDCSYYALASNFEPKEAGLKDWAKNHLMDNIFQGAENDLVVPTLGVYAVKGSEKFPIAERHVFPGTQGISHIGFFSDNKTQECLLKWLSY